MEGSGFENTFTTFALVASIQVYFELLENIFSLFFSSVENFSLFSVDIIIYD